jgi:hypothetical protein
VRQVEVSNPSRVECSPEGPGLKLNNQFWLSKSIYKETQHRKNNTNRLVISCMGIILLLRFDFDIWKLRAVDIKIEGVLMHRAMLLHFSVFFRSW